MGLSTPRCIWCNRRGELTTVALVVPDNLLAGEETRTFAVHVEHEPFLREFVAFLRRSKRPFLVSLGLTLGALPLGAILAVVLDVPERATLVALGLCASLVGTVLVVFPFPTPDTVGLLGINSACRLVRGLAMMLSTGGVLVALFFGLR